MGFELEEDDEQIKFDAKNDDDYNDKNIDEQEEDLETYDDDDTPTQYYDDLEE